MNFSLLLSAAPYSNGSHHAALQFAEAITRSEHQLNRVFFSGDAVYVGSQLIVSPQDEIDLTAAWCALADTHNADLVLCVSACLQRGILDQSEAERYQKPAHNLSPHFTISGLGQLVSAGLESDRIITFG